ncbi:hypothetical protein RRG08_023610 [Elysia crispata]|uniref:Uncharacterized protein n=1 Tax=Elysia crispata TaxID=231223 RepID=A0AAE1CL81_9GAST|nr:hypothetical protein RRG08_023610 [Elysia crispata]
MVILRSWRSNLDGLQLQQELSSQSPITSRTFEKDWNFNNLIQLNKITIVPATKSCYMNCFIFLESVCNKHYRL